MGSSPAPPAPTLVGGNVRIRSAGRTIRAVALGLITVMLMAIPTDIIDTAWFSREVPVRWWEYPTLLAIAGLTAFWYVIPSPVTGAGSAVGGVTLATFAIGCPVCRSEEHTSELQSLM